MITKSSVTEIKHHCKSHITTHSVKLWTISIFIKVRFQQKSMRTFFKIKKKTYFGVIFALREFFLETLAKYNYSGPPHHLNIKDTE